MGVGELIAHNCSPEHFITERRVLHALQRVSIIASYDAPNTIFFTPSLVLRRNSKQTESAFANLAGSVVRNLNRSVH